MRSDSNTGPHCRRYDPSNRRVSQSASDIGWWNYPTTAGSIAYAANNLNQYSAVGAVSPSYDGNGNLTYDGVFTYGYDAENRLTSVKQGAATVATYAYDAQGRRKSRTVGGATTLFATDAEDREVLEYDGASGAVTRWYAFGLGPEAVLNQMNVPAATRTTLIPDIQGSIIGTLDSGGTLSKSGYQPFGENPTVITGTYRYTAQRFDPETAGSTAQPSGLYYYRARTYSPTWGRFLQPDPIGYAAGNNLYAYVGNDPLNLTDPSGLLSFGGVTMFIGGSAEVAIGMGLGIATSWSGVGAVAGGAIALHGVDVAQAAWRGTDTFTSQGLQTAGLSQNTANAIDTGISGAAFIAAGAPIVPYAAPALSGGGAGTSLLSTAARTFLPRTVVDQSAGPVWNALRSYYGTGTKGALIGRVASDVSATAGWTTLGVSAAKEFVGAAK